MNTCKVSVCIPTYNGGTSISETIDSVLAQNFSDFELLVIDNSSTDNTASIVTSYVERDPRIKYLVNEVNLGMVGNWNRCLATARGEYIKFVFADDLLASPTALEQMVALLDSDESISLVCSARNIINESSQFIRVESHFDSGIMAGADVITRCIVDQNNFIGEPSVTMFRRSQAQRGFNARYNQIVDLEMWLHLLEQGSFAYINEPLCSFRMHQQQQTVKNRENSSHLKDFIYLLDDYLHKDYIKLSHFRKEYRQYDTLYGFWKLYKANGISRDDALELIYLKRRYSFYCWYPFYKLFKPFYKLVTPGFKQHNTKKTVASIRT